MKRSRAVFLTLITSVAAALLTGCDGRARRYCVDDGQNVIDDRNCEPAGHHGYHWYYARGYGSAHGGTHLTGGSSTPPASGYTSRSGANGGEGDAGGSARGGIGAAGEAASGGGHGGAGGGE
jgi:hypothetical protein